VGTDNRFQHTGTKVGEMRQLGIFRCRWQHNVPNTNTDNLSGISYALINMAKLEVTTVVIQFCS